MAAANPLSPSSSHTLYRCLTNPRRIHRPCLLKLACNSHDRRLRSIRCQTPEFEPKRSATSSDVTETSSSCIDFLTLCHSLKTTKRKGWVNHGIKGPESIADHMYRMALMALIAGDLPGINRGRCIKIAIVHDIAEAIVGDITPSDGVPKVEKMRLEQAALNEMCNVLGGGMRVTSEEIQELWREYEDNTSLEANLVKDFDKVEMILQALEYENEHDRVLDEFFLSTAGKFQTEIGKSWAAEIIARRNSSFIAGFHANVGGVIVQKHGDINEDSGSSGDKGAVTTGLRVPSVAGVSNHGLHDHAEQPEKVNNYMKRKFRSRRKAVLERCAEAVMCRQPTGKVAVEGFRRDESGGCMEEVEKVLGEMCAKGEFGFGSFWRGDDDNCLEEDFRICFVNQQLGYHDHDGKYHFVQVFGPLIMQLI
ncbi:hypothetical protein R6Q57_019808 [Mikania cordata]